MRLSGWGERQAVSKHVEVAVGGPCLPVADDVEASFSAAHGDVEQVGFAGGPAAGSVSLGVAAQHDDHNLSLFALRGVDRACYQARVSVGETADVAGDVAERDNHHDLRYVEVQLGERGENPLELPALGGNPVALTVLGCDIASLRFRQG
jgi:hypothetical protein